MVKLNSFQGQKDGSMYTNHSMWYINKREDQNRIVILRWRKSIWQNSLSIHDKNSHQNGNRRNISQHNKTIYDKLTANMVTQRWKAENLRAKFRNHTRMPTLTTSIQHSIGSPSHRNQAKKEENIQIKRNEVKLSYLQMTWYCI